MNELQNSDQLIFDQSSPHRGLLLVRRRHHLNHFSFSGPIIIDTASRDGEWRENKLWLLVEIGRDLDIIADRNYNPHSSLLILMPFYEFTMNNLSKQASTGRKSRTRSSPAENCPNDIWKCLAAHAAEARKSAKSII